MFDAIKDWALQGDMDGFDTLAAEEIGAFDYMSLLKGAGGMMSGAGGMFGGDKGGAAATPTARSKRSASRPRRRRLRLRRARGRSSAVWRSAP
jgi:hypothetical protein